MSYGLVTFDDDRWQELCDVISVLVFDSYENEEFRQIAKQNFSGSITFDTIEFDSIPIMTKYTIDQCMDYWARKGDEVFYEVCHGGFKRPIDIINEFFYTKQCMNDEYWLPVSRGNSKSTMQAQTVFKESYS